MLTLGISNRRQRSPALDKKEATIKRGTETLRTSRPRTLIARFGQGGHYCGAATRTVKELRDDAILAPATTNGLRKDTLEGLGGPRKEMTCVTWTSI